MPPVSKLFLAPSDLSHCLFGGIYRDTRGAVLPDADRVSHFPASALVTVSLVRQGSIYLIKDGADWRDEAQLSLLPRVSVVAPSDVPMTSWAPGQIEAVSFGMYPDAWQKLGGTQEVPATVLQAVDAFAAQESPEAGWQAFTHALSRAWADHRSSSWQTVGGVADWARSVITRAALSGRGQSIRALERRLKRQSGQTRRTLEFYAAFENLHRVSRIQSDSPLAEIALEAGFADQSHMGRTVRRATGFSPAYLNKAIETEEAFWCYRLLGERF